MKGEIDYIRRLGVEIPCKWMLAEKNRRQDPDACDALFVATVFSGLPRRGRRNAEGIVDGIRFLRGVNRGEHASPATVSRSSAEGTRPSIARGRQRGWAARPSPVYRCTREEMPAAGEEIEALLHEVIGIEFLAAPVRFRGMAERSRRWSASAWNWASPDERGCRRPVPKAGSEFMIPVDSVITASVRPWKPSLP